MPLNVVLVEPEIPPNTGNIARLCAATGARLHLVHPLGFRVDEKSVRRAGLDYWHLVEVVQHQSTASWKASLPAGARLHLFSTKGVHSHLSVRFGSDDHLVFGRESVGLSQEILDSWPDSVVSIPMPGAVRSLNVANAAAIALYEALRQLHVIA